jgi:hypothetical protein
MMRSHTEKLQSYLMRTASGKITFGPDRALAFNC